MLASMSKLFRKFGADDPVRTGDLLITNQLLYQLRYAGLGGRRPTGGRNRRMVAQDVPGGLVLGGNRTAEAVLHG